MANLRKYEILVSSSSHIDNAVWQQMWRALAPLRPVPATPSPDTGAILCGAFVREIAETHASVLAHALLSQKYRVVVRVRPQPEVSDLSHFG